MPEKKQVWLAASLDVEEEGLFSGRYQRLGATVANTRHLTRLAPLLERGVRPTLFCAHSALADASSRKILARLRDRHGAEIGAHLHHWNTPPLDEKAPATLGNVATKNVDIALMRAKMATLFKSARDFQGAPVASFRMGRWDMLAPHWKLLEENGVLCDASVRPLHRATPMGPDHFSAPNDPYLATATGIMEVPLTVTPLVPALAMSGLAESLGEKYQKNLKNWGALALLPVEHPLWLMKLTARLHISRGGRVLSLAWHSSEMMPGGSPKLPGEPAVNKFMAKITAWIDWLGASYNVAFATMAELRSALYPSLSTAMPAHVCDWSAGLAGNPAQK